MLRIDIFFGFAACKKVTLTVTSYFFEFVTVTVTKFLFLQSNL